MTSLKFINPIGIYENDRRHGLDRCLYPGQDGMKRWVGMGLIADNLINIGRHLAAKQA